MSTTMSKNPDEPLRRVEVITSVQRGRRGSVAEKMRLVEDAMQAGMSVSYVDLPRFNGEALAHLSARFSNCTGLW